MRSVSQPPKARQSTLSDRGCNNGSFASPDLGAGALLLASWRTRRDTALHGVSRP